MGMATWEMRFAWLAFRASVEVLNYALVPPFGPESPPGFGLLSPFELAVRSRDVEGFDWDFGSLNWR